MRVKLTDEDRCAIDLVLEHRDDASISPHCFDKGGAALRKRIDRVETLLQLFSLTPIVEPKVDLLAITLKHIKRNEHAMPPVPAAIQQPAVVSHSVSFRHLQ